MIKHNHIFCDLNGYSIYHDDEDKEADIDMEIAVPVSVTGENRDGFIFKELDAIPLAATIRFSGPYENYKFPLFPFHILNYKGNDHV